MANAAQISIALPDLPGIEAGWELVTLKPAAAAGKFTGERGDEAKRAAIIAALGEGFGIRATARAFRVSTNTVLAIRQSSAADIETEKQRAGGRFADLRDLAVERMIDEIDLMPRQSLPIVAGVATDKGELLRGAPTMRIEHNHSLTVASVADFIESLPVVSPVEAGETNGQKAGAIEIGEDPAETAKEPAKMGEVDLKSTEIRPTSEAGAVLLAENGQIQTQKEAGRPQAAQLQPGAWRARAQAGAEARGAGGVARFEGGGISLDGSVRE